MKIRIILLYLFSAFMKKLNRYSIRDGSRDPDAHMEKCLSPAWCRIYQDDFWVIGTL